MKYQIYLKKDTSDLINDMAEAVGTTPAHFIKILLENMGEAMETNLGVIMNELREASKNLTTK